MVPPRLVASLVMAFLAAVSFIVAIATPKWATTVGDIGVGLFKLSTPDGTTDYLAGVPDSLVAVRALEIIGLLGTVAGGSLGVLVFLLQLNRQSSIKFHLFAFATFQCAELLAIIGCVVFRTTAYQDLSAIYGFPDGTLGYSFALAIVASILGLLSGLSIFYAGRGITNQG